MLIDRMEEMRREFREQMKEWGKERGEIKKEIEVMGSRIEKLEKKIS